MPYLSTHLIFFCVLFCLNVYGNFIEWFCLSLFWFYLCVSQIQLFLWGIAHWKICVIAKSHTKFATIWRHFFFYDCTYLWTMTLKYKQPTQKSISRQSDSICISVYTNVLWNVFHFSPSHKTIQFYLYFCCN